jgi:putative transposase
LSLRHALSLQQPTMTIRFKNKYRITSARAPWWNYASAGSYFITICTKNRKHYFGEIINAKMQLTDAGVLAEKCWHDITEHAHNIELGEFLVMPNHIHGILILLGNVDSIVNPIIPVETRHALSLRVRGQPDHHNPQPDKSFAAERFQNQGKNSVSSIIGSYKSAVIKYAHGSGIEMAWQPRFHDHIIRNEQEYAWIANYIKSNPGNWVNDRFFQP